jgi:hypothetical protein
MMEPTMASKKTPTAADLEKLGASRLAGLLVELAEADASTRRRLKLELAAHEAPERLAVEVRKRLVRIAGARAFVDWHRLRGLAADLETERRTIVERVAKIDPADALELMWRFMDLADSVHARCDDSNGTVGDVFRLACRDLGPLAEAAKPDPAALADRAFTALNDNGHGQYDDLIATLAPALRGAGLDRLKARFVELSRTPVKKPPAEERKVVGWGTGGPFYRDEIEAANRKSTVRLVLQEIADAQGDVDGFIAQYDDKARKAPRIAAEVTRRLLAAGRAVEALGALEAGEPRRRDVEASRFLDRLDGWPEFDWEDARIEVLEVLGRADEAQAARWSCFERSLSAPHLRAHLERLPDFDDVEAERRALDHAERCPSALQALAFLVSWPALDRAAGLVMRRAAELDGDHYEILTPAVDALAGKHPLASTLALRAMIDFTLAKARSSRYRHAARHLMDCEGLAASIPDFGAVETHEAYVARLKAAHRRKSGFWSLVGKALM